MGTPRGPLDCNRCEGSHRGKPQTPKTGGIGRRARGSLARGTVRPLPHHGARRPLFREKFERSQRRAWPLPSTATTDQARRSLRSRARNGPRRARPNAPSGNHFGSAMVLAGRSVATSDMRRRRMRLGVFRSQQESFEALVRDGRLRKSREGAPLSRAASLASRSGC